MALLLSPLARGENDPTLSEAPNAAKPIVIVPPKIPAGHALPSDGVKVDIIGTAQIDGTFKPVSVTAPAGLESFAQAVSEVLHHWRFEPGIDHEKCVPKPEGVQISVWFEGSADNPQIAVSLPRIKDENQTQWPIEWSRVPRVQYPGNMRGVEGKVRILVLVSPFGDTLSASVLSGTAGGGFDYVSQRSAGAMKLRWKEPAPDKPVCMVKTYLFCMESAVNRQFAFAECSTERKR